MLQQELKKFQFYYWFAFPTVAKRVANAVAATPANQHFSRTTIEQLSAVYFGIADQRHRTFFVLVENVDGTFEHRPLDALIRAGSADRAANFADGTASLYFCFSDPSGHSNAGWPARLFLLMLLVLWCV